MDKLPKITRKSTYIVEQKAERKAFSDSGTSTKTITMIVSIKEQVFQLE